MANFVKVAEVGDVPPGTGKCVEADGKQIALFNVASAFHAIDNTCLHRGGPLGEGELEGTVVTCPWHGWQYDVTTGANLDDDTVRVARYEVKLEGGSILVGV
ncbi:MAG: Rieske 2Fe-2S domain-containing protein [Deltaproteobacteria bacterium]|nr:MAG: Rieske 2Fe-2S domain-containing protein [Deltaproteobacteria bacterium]